MHKGENEKIIDYHAHLGWDRTNNRFKTEELLEDMEINQIDKRMVSALYGYSIPEQNEAVARLSQENPDKIIACAVINPKERDALSYMKEVACSGVFRAVELDSLEHSYYPEICPGIDEIIDIATEHRMVVNCFTGWGPRTMPAQWTYYATRHPDMQMVLLHMGTTDFGYGCVDLVPQFQNVWVETSCMYEFPILRKAFIKIPKERFLFGTHFPHKFSRCSLDTFDLLNLPKDLQNCLFYQNAASLLGIEADETGI